MISINTHQANRGAYEFPISKCTDMNIVLHTCGYRERCSSLKPRKKNNHPLYFRVLPCTYMSSSIKAHMP